MNLNPGLSAQLAYERQNEILAQASKLRLARQARRASVVAASTDHAQPMAGGLLRRVRPVINPS